MPESRKNSMTNRYFINPSQDDLDRALESWNWLELQGKQVLLVTAFADVFFSASDGIWLLDTLEGKLKRICETQYELDAALLTEEMEDTYLMAPIVDYLINSGVTLADSECYDFKIHPRLGGQMHHENIEASNFVVSLNLRGQLLEQIRQMKPGTKISKFVMQNDAEPKPWWKFWA